jgi:hypothetical protein
MECRSVPWIEPWEDPKADFPMEEEEEAPDWFVLRWLVEHDMAGDIIPARPGPPGPGGQGLHEILVRPLIRSLVSASPAIERTRQPSVRHPSVCHPSCLSAAPSCHECA